MSVRGNHSHVHFEVDVEAMRGDTLGQGRKGETKLAILAATATGLQFFL